mmetsp:Transcript_3706/g.7035  ORF Transcript_3706/g.7035 Transcript_3706/m.7035 type:complete len:149 (-) Transcript_3706:93-539(-)
MLQPRISVAPACSVNVGVAVTAGVNAVGLVAVVVAAVYVEVVLVAAPTMEETPAFPFAADAAASTAAAAFCGAATEVLVGTRWSRDEPEQIWGLGWRVDGEVGSRSILWQFLLCGFCLLFVQCAPARKDAMLQQKQKSRVVEFCGDAV